jgi:phosphopantothenoylcysteine decarboxylase/phosphopantothenate--cysteine ligase
MRSGFEVRACLSRSATEFVTPALFEALTGKPVLTNVFDEPVKGRMAHIDWARDARVLLVCPATANAIAVLANGASEDMFTTIAQASRATMIIAPAMNPDMYSSIPNQENLARLRDRGAIVVEPLEGEVACGEQGQGKLASVDAIVAAVRESAFRSDLMKGKRIVITAGPTRESIDPVRYMSNRSSGKMGYELARACVQMGAHVTLISGPVALTAPAGAEVVRITSANEMKDAVLNAIPNADLLIGAAAVADYRAANTEPDKMKKSNVIEIRLVENPDILSEAHQTRPDLPIVGFAAETTNHEVSAKTKIEKKGLFAIAMNDVSRDDIGFDSDKNEVVLYFADGEVTPIPKSSKFNVAVEMIERIAKRLSW